MKGQIPENIIKVIKKLEDNNFEAFVVGGCVRDLLLRTIYGEPVEPKDWDVATSAKPKEIQKIFPDSVYENDFGTVGVKLKAQNSPACNASHKDAGRKLKTTTQNSKAEKKLKTTNYKLQTIIEVTTYRIESKYTDKRHPDEIKFAETLEEDLSRRDFTVNAMALKIKNCESRIKNQEDKPHLNSPLTKGRKSRKERDRQEGWNFEIVDLFNGQKDLENKTIRAVGEANERFNEDALRMMRAVRFSCTLNGGNKIQDTRYKIQTNSKFQSRSEYLGLGTNSEQITKNKLQTKNKGIDSDSPARIASQNEAGGEAGMTNRRWEIETKTLEAIKKNAENLKYISKERIRDELNKIILSNQPARGIDLLVETKLMKYIMPEIGHTIGVRQNRHHYYGPYNTVYKHMLASLEKCPSEKLEVRLAAFLHDLGKPKSKRGQGELATFHGHEYISARLVEKIMKRLKYPRKIIDKTVLLVKNHMFYYNVDEVGESGVRKVVRKVGLENINDLIDVRIADRLGSGVPKAVPYKLRHFKYMVEKVSKDPISVKQLKINGNDLIKKLEIKPGPKIGAILDVLLARVIDEPKLNTKKELLKLSKELEKENLPALRQMAKEKIKEEREKEDEGIKGKYWVK